MKIHEQILSMSGDLSIGDRSPHLVCPACGGGGSKEHSLLIWCDTGGLTYKCYRAKCGISGRVGEIGYREVSKVKRKPKLCTDTLQPSALPDDVMNWLLEWFWWMTPEMLHQNGVLWDECRERVLYPIKSIEGTHEGYIARRYDALVLEARNAGGAKALAYYNMLPEDYKLTCMMTPHMAQFDNAVVILEDYPSALRCNQHVPSIALSGTSIQESTLIALAKAGKKRVCIVLDNDAISKAARMTHRYGVFFQSISYVPLLGDDPKDMKDNDFAALIDKIKQHIGEEHAN